MQRVEKVWEMRSCDGLRRYSRLARCNVLIRYGRWRKYDVLRRYGGLSHAKS